MENNRWTDGLTVQLPPAERLTEDGRRLALKAVASRTPINNIPFQRKDETDEDRNAVRNAARQEVARIANFTIVEKPESEAEAGSPQEVTVEGVAKNKIELTPKQIEKAISLLEDRFNDQKNKKLCPKLSWDKAERTLGSTPRALGTILKAEEAGHEPTICFSDEAGFVLATRSDETPQSTRDCVYDEVAEQWWKENRPNEKFNGNAVSQAREMGWDLQEVELANHIAANTPAYTEQGLSWFKTELETRKTDHALFGLRNKGCVDVEQRDAAVHYGYRGWRGALRVNFVD